MEKKLTKREMVTEIMEAVIWCPTTTERNIERGVKYHSLEHIEKVYKAFTEDREHAKFYATILAR